ncbi:MAG: Holliday junction resolvase RuvX [Oscillospiraceae bacterium]|nr:Holliday junction resolvase RuvX [Oscillospiraceae bacterium]
MKIMAVDLGDARTGLAVCDKLEILASPLCVIKETDFNLIIKKISNEIINNKIEEVVIGYPKNMNGSIGERAKKSELLADELKKIVPEVSIKLWDERNTTRSATIFLNQTNTRGAKRKKIIDSVAATIILESYINFKKQNLK